MTERPQYKKKLAMTLASLAFVVVGSAAFLTSNAIDIYAITNVLMKTTPAALVLGVLGYFLGSIFDNKKAVHKHFTPPPIKPEINKEVHETEKLNTDEEWDEI